MRAYVRSFVRLAVVLLLVIMAFVPFVGGIWYSNWRFPAEVGMTWHPVAGACLTCVIFFILACQVIRIHAWRMRPIEPEEKAP